MKQLRSLRKEVLEQVRTCGGFSVFWACDNLRRAKAIMRLQKTGVIVRRQGAKNDVFPWCVYEIIKV
jgi:hypothetical protein